LQNVAWAAKQLNATKWLETRAYIGSDWIATVNREEVRDPATQEIVASVSMCGPDLVDRAVELAELAQRRWAARLPAERGRYIRRWAELVREHAEELAVIIVTEQGKPRREALCEVEYAASYLDWFAAEGERAYTAVPPSHRANAKVGVGLHPIGVVCAITPWNFPCAMIARKAGAALAAGCSVIIKPAPETPLSALALARLAEAACIPAGTLQVVTGEAHSIVTQLLANTSVRAVSFTGSTEVGRSILAASAQTVKKSSMELGGNAPFIGFADAPLDALVSNAMTAKFTTGGQDCLAANRIFIERPIYEKFIARFSEQVSKLVVGHGLEESVQIGPLTKRAGADRCRRQIAKAQQDGARLVVGGIDDRADSNFVSPTVLADGSDTMAIAREELFAPVATILGFDDEEEVIARANATEMGLAAYVFTDNAKRAIRVSDQLEYGMVGVNTASFTGPPIPFGGWKQSGLGREGAQLGITEFMELKYVCYGNLSD
jgi:succinate-semialdehyde dehydrogenase/glutarate-semialdehyde dehydrogenase/aspartate-semialdehyde dehydrogenase